MCATLSDLLAKKQSELLKAFARKAESVSKYRAEANKAKLEEEKVKAAKEIYKVERDRARERASEYQKNYQAAAQSKVDVRITKRRAKKQVQRLTIKLDRFKAKDQATNGFRKEAALAQARLQEIILERDRAIVR